MKKKIMIIHHSGLMGGAGVSLYNLWLTLKDEYDVVTYIPDDPKDLSNFFQEKKIEPRIFSFRLGKITYYSGGNNLFSYKFWYHMLHSVTQISYWKKIICTEKPDLIIVNSKVLCWMGILFNKLNVKSVCFVRETIKGKSNSIINKMLNSLLDKFSVVTFLSNYDIEQTKLKKAEVVLTPDYLDIEEYYDTLGKQKACKLLGLDSNSFNVLFVGGVNSLKGIDIALKAINILEDKNINLIIAGKGLIDENNSRILDLRYKLKNRNLIRFSKMIRDFIIINKIGDKVKFIGTQNDMSVAYSACDVLIFPMKSPHQARPAFEIGAQKKPVIITRFPNIVEYVKDDYNGITFKLNNYKDLASAIEKLYMNPDLIKDLGENNYGWTLKYHTKENAMKDIVEKIRRII